MQDFDSIYTTYYRRSFELVKSYTHNRTVAEDIVLDVLMDLWAYLKQHPTDSFEGLLLTMLKNRSLDYLKHLAVVERANTSLRQDYLDELQLRVSLLENFDTESVFSHEILDIYRRTMSRLPEQTRRIFEMSRFDNKSQKEMAAELNVSVKTVEYHISKALKELRVDLKDYLPLLLILLHR